MNRALLTFCSVARDAIHAIASASGTRSAAARQLHELDQALEGLRATAAAVAKARRTEKEER